MVVPAACAPWSKQRLWPSNPSTFVLPTSGTGTVYSRRPEHRSCGTAGHRRAVVDRAQLGVVRDVRGRDRDNRQPNRSDRDDRAISADERRFRDARSNYPSPDPCPTCSTLSRLESRSTHRPRSRTRRLRQMPRALQTVGPERGMTIPRARDRHPLVGRERTGRGPFRPPSCVGSSASRPWPRRSGFRSGLPVCRMPRQPLVPIPYPPSRGKAILRSRDAVPFSRSVEGRRSLRVER